MENRIIAEVVELLEHSQTKGITKIKCMILDEENKNKLLVRNVIGPIQKKDILILPKIDAESGTHR
ncbi:MAG: 30S ribosomal protein S28e [Candidatus Aenigmarchaeota archaeon ex4484_52]|nr:MAG: 30S ribosomal protein S28e [Candidatus Aenigmarchaeota archaeon ex4484_52]